ncbi:MAG TPA: ATP-binding protein [Gammaproteobacteria bacterium]|nr:ATP-binding protein [Gammaproteobacteria bacterium]
MEIKDRLLNIKLPTRKSAFLWGPRQVGKSYWIKHHLRDVILIDLLKTDVFSDYVSRPMLLRERYADTTQRIVIDEIQKVPDLLNEVHWLIENKNISFLMTGSSARKLRQKHVNLLGGRAWRYTMTPLSYAEISDFDLKRALISGLLPPHLLSPDSMQALRAYIADYLKEEIVAEAVIQNIPAFSDFLRIAAITSGELLNYTNVARETGVSAKIVRSYFQILEDTLLGFRLQPWRRAKTRRLIETEKFYLFDVGVANYLAQRKPSLYTPEFGKSFEHFILMELKAYQAYRNPELLLHYWRTSTGLEVDFILGDMEVAVEIKAAKRTYTHDIKGLQALNEGHTVKRSILVSFEQEQKRYHHIECLPWTVFLEQLWAGKLM